MQSVRVCACGNVESVVNFEVGSGINVDERHESEVNENET